MRNSRSAKIAAMAKEIGGGQVLRYVHESEVSEKQTVQCKKDRLTLW